MIYDCFTYFGGPNEDDLLRLRLEELRHLDTVHVLVESDHSFTGKYKGFTFDASKFAEFPIKYIRVTDLPLTGNPRDNETHQRNAIMRGLAYANDDDAVIISDLDEIPRASSIAQYKIEFGDCALIMDSMLFYLNVLATRQDLKVSRILSYRILKYTTPQQIRASGCPLGMLDAGWHFTCMGGTDAILTKFQNFCHQEEEIQRFAKREIIDRRIADLKSIWKEDKVKPVGLDQIPEYAKNLKHMLYEGTN